MTTAETATGATVDALTLPYAGEPANGPVVDTSGALTARGWDDSALRRLASRVWRWLTIHGPLLLILLAQAIATVRLANSAYEDESLYLYAGHREIALLLHHTPTYDAYPTYFSGAPMLYPVVAAAVEGTFGLGGARNLNLVFMLLATAFVFAVTRQLFGRAAATGAAAVFALSEPVLFIGHLATYDAPALCLLAAAAWVVVRFAHRSAAFTMLAAPMLLLAAATKYAAFLYVPSVIVLAVLAAVGVKGWPRAIGRGAILSVATGGLFTAAWLATSQSLHVGIHVTTLNRLVGTDAPLEVLGHAGIWAGGALLLCGAGAFLCLLRRWPADMQRTLVRTRGQRVWLGVVLMGTGLLAPATQAHLHTLISLPKHLGFGLLFAAPLAGVALARMLGATRQDPKRLGLVLVICLALAWNGMVESRVQFLWWPNSAPLVQELRTQIQPVTGRFLVEIAEPPRYYLSNLTQPYQWVGTFGYSYTNTKGKSYTGLAAYQQAIDDKYFDVIVLSWGPAYGIDEQLFPQLASGTSYRLIDAIQYHAAYGPGTWYVFRVNR